MNFHQRLDPKRLCFASRNSIEIWWFILLHWDPGFDPWQKQRYTLLLSVILEINSYLHISAISLSMVLRRFPGALLSTFDRFTMEITQPDDWTGIIIPFPTSLSDLFSTAYLKLCGISSHLKKMGCLFTCKCIVWIFIGPMAFKHCMTRPLIIVLSEQLVYKEMCTLNNLSPFNWNSDSLHSLRRKRHWHNCPILSLIQY